MLGERVNDSLSFSRLNHLPLLRVLADGFQTSLIFEGYSFRDEKSLGLDGEGKRPVGRGKRGGWRLREASFVKRFRESTRYERQETRDAMQDRASLSGYLVCLVYLVGGEEGWAGPGFLVCGFVSFLSLFEPDEPNKPNKPDPATDDDAGSVGSSSTEQRYPVPMREKRRRVRRLFGYDVHARDLGGGPHVDLS
jgi:hypothetical protein